MGIINAIGGFFSGVASGVSDLAGKVWGAIRSLAHVAGEVFHLVGGAWDWVFNGLGWLGNNIIGGLARVLHLIEWLALHAIPEGLGWVLGQAVSWAKRALHDLSGWVKGALSQVTRWAEHALHTLESWARSAVRDVWHTLSAAWHFIETVGKRVADLVLHPDRLVAWFLAALIVPLLRALLKLSAGILVWFIRLAVSLLPAVASTLEDVLAKLL